MAFTTLITLSSGYKILFLAPFYGKSHTLYMQSFVRELLNRNHEVTFLTSHSLDHLNLANYTEILIDPPFPAAEASESKYLFCGKKIVWNKTYFYVNEIFDHWHFFSITSSTESAVWYGHKITVCCNKSSAESAKKMECSRIRKWECPTTYQQYRFKFWCDSERGIFCRQFSDVCP